MYITLYQRNTIFPQHTALPNKPTHTYCNNTHTHFSPHWTNTHIQTLYQPTPPHTLKLSQPLSDPSVSAYFIQFYHSSFLSVSILLAPNVQLFGLRHSVKMSYKEINDLILFKNMQSGVLGTGEEYCTGQSTKMTRRYRQPEKGISLLTWLMASQAQHLCPCFLFLMPGYSSFAFVPAVLMHFLPQQLDQADLRKSGDISGIRQASYKTDLVEDLKCEPQEV